jgi:hypothetical protein
MLRSTTKALALLVLASALSGCGSDPPHVELSITDMMSPPLSGLERLRLIVRTCPTAGMVGTGSIAIAMNLTTGAPNAPIDGDVAPGEQFYIWVQGWVRCTPQPGSTCVDTNSAVHGKDCECITSELDAGTTCTDCQLLAEDYCSTIITAAAGRTVVNATLGPVGTCPPSINDCKKM